MTVAMLALDNANPESTGASYATVEQADAYLLGDLRYAETWGGISVEIKKNVLLVYASRRVDLHSFAGSKSNESQTTQFPRNGDIDVPIEVERATILEAAFLAANSPSAKASQTEDAQIKRIVGERDEVEYFQAETFSTHSVQAGVQDSAALALLRPFFGGDLSFLDFPEEKERLTNAKPDSDPLY